jgi:hypothetical protein
MDLRPTNPNYLTDEELMAIAAGADRTKPLGLVNHVRKIGETTVFAVRSPITGDAHRDNANELCRFGVGELTAGFSSGKFTPLQVAQATLARAEQVQERFNAFSLIDKTESGSSRRRQCQCAVPRHR